MKKKTSKLMVFMVLIISVVSLYTIYQIVEITRYIMQYAPYSEVTLGEIVSCYSSIITYVFYIAIMIILCGIYKKRKMITEPVISEEDKEFIHNELSRPTFVWKDQNTDIEELEKKLAILEKKVENKVDKSTENIVDKSKVKTAKKTTTKKSNSNLTKEEEEKIQKDLAKAVEKYENKETEEMEKKLSKAIAKHSSVNHKKANMNMTKDELLKFAAKNDVYATEDMTKAEIIEKINMETQPESKSKKK